jgi:hypothetical protein
LTAASPLCILESGQQNFGAIFFSLTKLFHQQTENLSDLEIKD